MLRSRYQRGSVALVLAFLNFCRARGVNYKLSKETRFIDKIIALQSYPFLLLSGFIIFLLYSSSVWSNYFDISVHFVIFWKLPKLPKLARPRLFNTRNNSSWICCSDNIINFLFEQIFAYWRVPSSLFSFQFYWSIGDGPSIHASPCNQNIGCSSCIRVSEYRKW